MGAANPALAVHNLRVRELRQFPARLAEAELVARHGPAFARSYGRQERLAVAAVISTIRSLHRSGHGGRVVSR